MRDKIWDVVLITAALLLTAVLVVEAVIAAFITKHKKSAILRLIQSD